MADRHYKLVEEFNTGDIDVDCLELDLISTSSLFMIDTCRFECGEDGMMPTAVSNPLYERGHEIDGIRDVWNNNVEEEFKIIRELVKDYPYISMDTEFPGIVAHPIGDFINTSEFHYQSLRCNVDMLRLIQLGLTFQNEHGETPPGPCCTWQFNFKFSLRDDIYAQDSINLLRNSGIQFEKHQAAGIHPDHFAELIMSSGIVLMDKVTFLSFHSGYDFGYLLKLLTGQHLPVMESEFFEILQQYFPIVYDVKHLMKSCNLKGGLQDLATQLNVPRTGKAHQAGSDSMLTGRVFFELRQTIFNGYIDKELFCGHLYGLGPPHSSMIAEKDNEQK